MTPPPYIDPSSGSTPSAANGLVMLNDWDGARAEVRSIEQGLMGRGPCTYVLWSGAPPHGVALYVGFSEQVRVRIDQHRRRAARTGNEFDSVQVFRHATRDGAFAHEQELIERLRPTDNVARGGAPHVHTTR